MRTALVVMPYASTRTASIQCGVLKASLSAADLPCDVHYLNMPFAKRAGLAYYESLAHGFDFLCDWSFAQTMIGRRPAAEEHAARALELLEKRRGFEPARYWPLLDKVAGYLDDCERSVDWGAYGLIGFSSVFHNHYASLALARRIKARFPSARIVFGGPNVEGSMGLETLRAFPFVEAVVDGEGEQAVVALARAASEGKSFAGLQGVATRGEDGRAAPATRPPLVSLEDSPFPDYGDYFAALRAHGLEGAIEPFLMFEGSRGCWWGEARHCVFCGLNPETIGYRAKSPKRLLAELDHLSETYRITCLHAVDNILDLRGLDELLPELERRAAEGRPLSFFFETKSNLKRALIARLKAAGIRWIQPGIESLSTDVLAIMRKGVTALQNVEGLRACREHGLDATWNVLFGFPGETQEHYDEMLRLLPKVTHLQAPDVVQPWSMQRFSPYQREPELHGIKVEGPGPDSENLYPPDVADAMRITYSFKHSLADGRPADAYVGEVRRFVKRWHGELQKKTFFHFALGKGFARLYDYRLRSASDAQPTFQRSLLEGWQAELFAFCVDARATGEAVRFAGERFGVAEPAVRAALEEWAARGWVLGERGRWLTLALPMPPDPRPLLERCQKLELLEAAVAV